ncbi:hypothetical protein DMC30DRAFT_412962 [Rhodotorula diobovata]|uniref:Uncharacterized protein n=1 Tax=Rhodotorula diobovata TaxID=5288 RepID=A0A5C5G6F9_9BASI|nr:hypothetical protein DMC30DRAFT_412962 [Rhodotorula diobovata]
MLLYFDDNAGDAVSYSTAWTTYVRDTGAVNATSWLGGTFHSCSASSQTSLAAGCNATITFTGTKIWVIGDWNPNQGIYYCALLNEGQPWRWFNASTLSSPYPGQTGLNHTRCQLSGLENKQHTLVFGQTQDDVINNGITIDYYVVDNATDSTVSTLTWASDFVAGRPDADYQWSVQTSDSSATTSAVSSFTSASSSATASSKSGSSSSTTAIGVGVGVGVGCAVLLALAAVWWIIRRRRRADDAQTVVTEPHHELKARSGSFDGGFVPYATTTMSGHADHRPSQLGVPEVQHSPTTPYYSASAYGESEGSRLDSPATFRPRGF